MVQGVDLSQPLRGITARKVDTSVGLASGTLGVKPKWSADTVSGISSAVGFPAPLVEVSWGICGRNVKVLFDYGSTGNCISDSLIPALGMEVILEKNFEWLEMADRSWVKAQGYVSFRLDSGEVSFKLIARVFPSLHAEVLLGQPWFIQENPDIDWIIPKVKVWRRGHIKYLPIYYKQDSEDHKDKKPNQSSRISMCSAKAFNQHMRKQK